MKMIQNQIENVSKIPEELRRLWKMEKKNEKKKSKKKHDGCKTEIQPEWEKRKKAILEHNESGYRKARKSHKPAVRINSSKGHHYVQYRDTYGKWDTIGKLNPRNLGIGFGKLVAEMNDLQESDMKAKAVKKGVFNSLESEEEFDKATKDLEARMEAGLRMFKARLKKDRRLRKRQMKALRKVMTPELKEEPSRKEEKKRE